MKDVFNKLRGRCLHEECSTLQTECLEFLVIEGNQSYKCLYCEHLARCHEIITEGNPEATQSRLNERASDPLRMDFPSHVEPKRESFILSDECSSTTSHSITVQSIPETPIISKGTRSSCTVSYIPDHFSNISLSILNGEEMSTFKFKKARHQLVREIQNHLDENCLITSNSTMTNRKQYMELGDQLLKKFHKFKDLAKQDGSDRSHPCQELLSIISGRRRSKRHYHNKLEKLKKTVTVTPEKALEELNNMLFSDLAGKDVPGLLKKSYSLRKDQPITVLPFYLIQKDSILCEVGLRIGQTVTVLIEGLVELEKKFQIYSNENSYSLVDIETFLKNTTSKPDRFLCVTNDPLSSASEQRPGPCVLLNKEENELFLYSIYDQKFIILSGSFSLHEACLIGFGAYFLVNLEYPLAYCQFLGLLEIYLKATTSAFPVALRGKKLKQLIQELCSKSRLG